METNVSTLKTLPKGRSKIETYTAEKESEIQYAHNKIGWNRKIRQAHSLP